MANPWLHRCAILVAATLFLTIFTGAAVTSNEDRPYYSVGQTHMWLAIAAGLLTIAVAFWLRSAHEPLWLRRLGWGALAAVILQAAVGFQPMPQAPALRITHVAVAQLLFSAIVVLAFGTSRAWHAEAKRVVAARSLRLLGDVAPVVVLAQVALGTLFRHGVLGVGLHLIGAFVAVFFILGVTLPVIYKPEHLALHSAARALLTIASVQVFVGLTLFSMQSMDVDPGLVILVTMIHAATGALTLAATVLLALMIRRHTALAS